MRTQNTGFVLLASSCLCFQVLGLDIASRVVAGESSADATEPSDVAIPLAGHSEHGEAYNEGPRQDAYLMGGTGKVDFPVTTSSDEAQAFFDQGLGQLYGFWYYEAERSFRRVAAIDPECAMAYWGMARANDENKDRAKSFIDDAMKNKDSASEREQMYIEALEKYLTDDGEDKQVRTAYIKALEKIIREYPDDIEAKAMLAVHLWQSDRKGVPINSHQAVDSLLGDVFRVEPMHPAHHFRIHLWDNEEPAEALESAARCGQAAPTIAHMWHMPGHIYSRLNRFNDAVFQQSASARADHAHMMRDGVLPDQIHNYAHNNEWLIRNLIHLGRAQDALSLAKNMLELPRHPKYNSFKKSGMCSCKYGRRRLLQVLETFEMWDDVVELADTMYLEPTEEKEEQGKRLRLLGVAHYHRGESELVQSSIDGLERLLTRFDEDVTKAGDEAAEKKRSELDAEQAEQLNEAEKNQDEKLAADFDSTKDTGEEKGESGDGGESKVESEAKTGAEIEEDRDKQIEDARKKAERREKRGKKTVERALAELRGVQFLARGETDEAIKEFEDGDIAKPRLARYQFLAGDHEKARELVKKSVESSENQVRPLASQVDLLRRMGNREEAKAAFEKLRTVAGVADLDTPVVAKLQRFAKELSWPTDWRNPPKLADDIGDRPELDSLGPIRWAPSPAPAWELVDDRESTVSLAHYHGRPVVVIFYLGAGCLHCVEQLHEFAPMLDDFEEEGIAMVAISTESTAGLAEAITSFSKDGVFPIPLAANPSLDVFKRYRVYDDFEQMPLHGTFLIDGRGMIRWQDISYEPFLDPKFLLAESKRLLSTGNRTDLGNPVSKRDTAVKAERASDRAGG